jgi:hypothetical protein
MTTSAAGHARLALIAVLKFWLHDRAMRPLADTVVTAAGLDPSLANAMSAVECRLH